ncbi:hypothetical protein ACFL5M_02890 [Candidatus Neomarinimicrobiota bacterium]
MPVQLNPDVGSTLPQQDTLARKVKSLLNNAPGERTDTTVRVQYTRTEVYNVQGKLQVSDDGSGSLLDAYLEIKQIIKEQLTLIAGPEVFGTSEASEDDAVAMEGIPEYWNKENTARRIFAIAMMGYEEGSDREAFADKAIAMVKQAYTDVGATLDFEFPQLVTDTKEAVLSALEQFKNGSALSEISFE